ncbi:hexosaminidase subunit [Seminavis robusta]|uniref:Beta-hexosaminidase n=1 Tax=Seminavis robusta TaxID=568900 RepID=A0A9N8E3W3_9STRA|nr:hexosaminidase subunit [Seminavis robusta]|eukprot:Sro526_g160340.1 hexosaminidase subunit (536) ;mRNA; f:17392-18999
MKGLTATTNRIAIIPRPVRVEEKSGHFTITESSCIYASEGALAEAKFLAEVIRPSSGLEIAVKTLSQECDCKGHISLALIRTTDDDDDPMDDEAYTLDVSECNVKIKAATAKGLFYGIQSLLQLLPPNIFRKAMVKDATWTIPCVGIEDTPRFKWRGMHLDSGRHFMPKEFVLKLIDLMAFHKLNSFHWHLTEDQGWRIEIKAYPKLTEISAWRDETLIGHHRNNPRVFDGRRHGGFYSQDDIREVVAYAARRHITVVPEIEMPGHTVAVLAAYPELGCTNGPYQVRTMWHFSEDVFCAGNEATFTFLQNVLTEVMELFPSKYIHIGGDECPKARWKECSKCQKRIQNENLKDEHELQSYFIKRIESFLNENGRSLIGWDEILEGGLAPNATVMSWRGTEGGIQAANEGHSVVFAPASHTYLDHCQTDDVFAEPLAIGGNLPLEKVYSYEPMPEELLTAGKGHHVLGAQGQLWSEYFPNPKHVEYMAFPRLTALSEVVWSPREGKSFENFLGRLDSHLKRLDVLDVNYRRLDHKL